VTDPSPFEISNDKLDNTSRCTYCKSIDKVLTPDQYDQYVEAMKNRKIRQKVIVDILREWGVEGVWESTISRHRNGKAEKCERFDP
jgi:hypothetical protein